MSNCGGLRAMLPYRASYAEQQFWMEQNRQHIRNSARERMRKEINEKDWDKVDWSEKLENYGESFSVSWILDG